MSVPNHPAGGSFPHKIARQLSHFAIFQPRAYGNIVAAELNTEASEVFDLLIRSHHCTDNCFGLLRILFGHEVTGADTTPSSTNQYSTLPCERSDSR